MKLSMHKHFVLLTIAVLFEFNKITSSRRGWRSNVNCAWNIFNNGNVNCGGHRAKTCSLCPCNQQSVYETYHGSAWCSGDCQWRGGHRGGECIMRQNTKNCAGAVFNTGNVMCGNHRARTCSQCACKPGIPAGQESGWCSGDCQWRGDHLNGVCRMKRKIKGEWHSRDTTIQGMLWWSWTGQC